MDARSDVSHLLAVELDHSERGSIGAGKITALSRSRAGAGYAMYRRGSGSATRGDVNSGDESA